MSFKDDSGTSSGEDAKPQQKLPPIKLKSAKPQKAPADGWLSCRTGLSEKERLANIKKAKESKRAAAAGSRGKGKAAAGKAAAGKASTKARAKRKKRSDSIDEFSESDDSGIVGDSESDIEYETKPKKKRAQSGKAAAAKGSKAAQKRGRASALDSGSSSEAEFQSGSESEDVE
eukprot:19240-Heterococcus_DN1.PRE.1